MPARVGGWHNRISEEELKIRLGVEKIFMIGRRWGQIWGGSSM